MTMHSFINKKFSLAIPVKWRRLDYCKEFFWSSGTNNHVTCSIEYATINSVRGTLSFLGCHGIWYYFKIFELLFYNSVKLNEIDYFKFLTDTNEKIELFKLFENLRDTNYGRRASSLFRESSFCLQSLLLFSSFVQVCSTQHQLNFTL